MAQSHEWDKEYQNNRLVTGSNEPQNDFKRFYKYLRKIGTQTIDTLHVLDLGSGTGKNSIFLAERGATVTGLDISQTALSLAKKRAVEADVETTFIHQSFGEVYPFENNSFNLVLDVMSSNSLSEGERSVYLSEVDRVLSPGGHFFVRLLARDGDKHAETLIRTHPGTEPGTYRLPEVGIVERVLSEKEFRAYYEPLFTIVKLERKSGYMRVGKRLYKRQYWIGYLQKPL